MLPSHKGTCDLSLLSLSSFHKLGSRFAVALLTSPPCDTHATHRELSWMRVERSCCFSLDRLTVLYGWVVKRRRDFRGPSFCPLIFELLLAILLRRKSLSAAPTSGIPLPRISGICGPLCVNQCFAFWIKRMFCAHVVCECCRGIPVFKAFLAIQSTRFCYASLDVGGSFQTPLLPLPDILLPSRFPEVNFFLFRLLGCTFRSNDCWSADVLTFWTLFRGEGGNAAECSKWRCPNYFNPRKSA